MSDSVPAPSAHPEPRCNMCGLCCHFLWKGKVEKCRHLVKFKNGKTLCRIYPRRLGTTLAYDPQTNERVICTNRQFSQYDYPHCEYNQGKPMVPWVKEEHVQLAKACQEKLEQVKRE